MMKNRIRLLSVIIWIVLLVRSSITLSAQTESFLVNQRVLFAGGSGSSEEPYLIEKQSHLDNIRLYPDAHYLQTEDIRLEGEWLPIALFQGVYDGNGYSIYNLKINRKDDNAGLFGILDEGILMRINIRGGDIRGRNSVGSLVGSNEGGKILNCSAGVIVTGNNDVGGLAGSNFGIINESFSYSAKVTGTVNIGGLVGANYGGEIRNCYSTNEITGNSSLGGLVGLNIVEGLVANCYSVGKIEKIEHKPDHLSERFDFIGGLIGRTILADTENSYWDTESSGQTVSAGGIGKTTVRMMQQETFHGWAFGPIWAIEEWYTEPNSTYPYFTLQGFPGEYNKPINKQLKIIPGSGYHWVSFPWLSRDQLLEDPPERRQTAEEALRPVNNDNIGYIDRVLYWDASADPPGHKEMVWVGNEWDPDNIVFFNSIQGFIIDVNHQDPFNIPFYGTIEDPETEFSIYVVEEDTQGEGNWIGYFLEDQYVFDAFGDRIHDFKMIKTQNVGMYWDENLLEWYYDNIVTPEGPLITYGSMVKVTLRENQDIHDFRWNIPQNRSSERQSSPKSKPQHFEISYGTDYESIFIADITDDEDVVEIGVYVDGVCVGASVLTGLYPLEILAYTNNTQPNNTMTFVLYLDDDTYERYDSVLVKDLSTRGYSRRVLTQRENLFTIVKLDRVGGERGLAVPEEPEEVLQPLLRLGQNYPNPFSLKRGIHGQGTTNISLTLPADISVNLNIYNIRGQLVRKLVSGKANKGDHIIVWDGKDDNSKTVSSGIYFYRLETEKETITRKMLIVR